MNTSTSIKLTQLSNSRCFHTWVFPFLCNSLVEYPWTHPTQAAAAVKWQRCISVCLSVCLFVCMWVCVVRAQKNNRRIKVEFNWGDATNAYDCRLMKKRHWNASILNYPKEWRRAGMDIEAEKGWKINADVLHTYVHVKYMIEYIYDCVIVYHIKLDIFIGYVCTYV